MDVTPLELNGLIRRAILTGNFHHSTIHRRVVEDLAIRHGHILECICVSPQVEHAAKVGRSVVSQRTIHSANELGETSRINRVHKDNTTVGSRVAVLESGVLQRDLMPRVDEIKYLLRTTGNETIHYIDTDWPGNFHAKQGGRIALPSQVLKSDCLQNEFLIL